MDETADGLVSFGSAIASSESIGSKSKPYQYGYTESITESIRSTGNQSPTDVIVPTCRCPSMPPPNACPLRFIYDIMPF